LDLRSLENLEGEMLLRAVEEQMAGMKEDGRLLPEEAEYVRSRDIAAFAGSPLGQRMAAADAREELYREQPFVLGMDAAEIHDYWPSGEEVFVQGIIDAFFYEPDGRDGLKLILVDYKTDRVSGPEQLRGRYQVQLDSYAEALGRITGIPVAEKLIWSFCLGQELSL
jgi:ATP-dependent helicase/nuclease subunit A